MFGTQKYELLTVEQNVYSPHFRYCYDVNIFMNLFKKIRSELKLSLPFLIFYLVVTVFFSIYLHSTCYISLPKKILLLYFRQRVFLSFCKHFNE